MLTFLAVDASSTAGNTPAASARFVPPGFPRRRATVVASVDDTKELVARAQAGDEAAFNALFMRYRETVARIVFRVMGPSADAEDVVQDVFIHVFRSISKFRGEAKFTTWLYRLTVNVTRMHLRKGRSRPKTIDVPMPESRPDVAPAQLPDDLVDRNERVEALYGLLDRLSDKKQTVLILHDFEGLSPKEISDIVEAPILTVRTRLFYARKELYAAMASEPRLGPQVEAIMAELPGRPRTKKQAARSSRPSLANAGSSGSSATVEPAATKVPSP